MKYCMFPAPRFVMTLLLLAAVTSAPAAASTFLAQTTEQLTSEADSVVEGRVVAVRSFWNEQHTVILTEADVEVEATVLGEAGGLVTVRTFGGRIGNRIVEAHGFPTFKKGERLLLFLEPEVQGAHKVLGYQQGQYRLQADAKGREIAVPAFQGGARLVLPNGAEAPAPTALPIEQLEQQIQRAAERIGRPVNRVR